MELIIYYTIFTTYLKCIIEFQIMMNVTPTLHAETMVPVSTQLAHTVAFAQVDGQAQTVPQVKKQLKYHQNRLQQL